MRISVENIKSLADYSNGILNGKSESYSKNGKLESQVIFKNGRLAK